MTETEQDRGSYSRLPSTPEPSQWQTSQDVQPVTPRPAVFTFDEDEDFVLRNG